MARCSRFRQAVAQAYGGEFHQIEAGGGACKDEEEIEGRCFENAERFISDESMADEKLLPEIQAVGEPSDPSQGFRFEDAANEHARMVDGRKQQQGRYKCSHRRQAIVLEQADVEGKKDEEGPGGEQAFQQLLMGATLYPDGKESRYQEFIHADFGVGMKDAHIHMQPMDEYKLTYLYKDDQDSERGEAPAFHEQQETWENEVEVLLDRERPEVTREPPSRGWRCDADGVVAEKE